MHRSDSRLSLNAFLVLTAFTVILAGCVASTGTTTDSDSSASASASAPSAMSEGTQGAYKDGTYTAEGQYVSPAGQERVEVTLTLDDGVITGAQFVGKAENPASVKLQGQFKDGFQAVVVGKPIDQLSLSVVNGSSLAPKGFMDAVAKIKVQAKA